MNPTAQKIYRLKKYSREIPSLFSELKERVVELEQIKVALKTTQIDINSLHKKTKIRLELLTKQYCTTREIQLFSMRYGFGEYDRGHTLEEVGREFDITRDRVRQLEDKILMKIDI